MSALNEAPLSKEQAFRLDLERIVQRAVEQQLSLSPRPPTKEQAYSVDEFCTAHRISRGLLYLLWQQRRGPRWMKIGSRRLISAEAAAEWRRAMEVGA